MNAEPKISTVEAILLIFFALIADLVNALPFINILSTIATFTILQLYFNMKGVKSGVSLVTQLLEFIPLISILPFTTAGVVATIVIDHNQKLAQAVLASASGAIVGGAVAKEAVSRKLAGETTLRIESNFSENQSESTGKIIPFRVPESQLSSKNIEKPRLAGIPKGPFKNAA